MSVPWDDLRLDQTEQQALACTNDDACTLDVVLLIGEVRRLHAAVAEQAAEIERLRRALEHAAHVLYRIGNERRTDDAHKISAHVEHVRMSSVLHGLDPDHLTSE